MNEATRLNPEDWVETGPTAMEWWQFRRIGRSRSRIEKEAWVFGYPLRIDDGVPDEVVEFHVSFPNEGRHTSMVDFTPEAGLMAFWKAQVNLWRLIPFSPGQVTASYAVSQATFDKLNDLPIHDWLKEEK